MKISKNDFETICRFLKEKSGMNLDEGKIYLVETHLLPVIRKFGFKDFSELSLALATKPSKELCQETVEALTINETSFFRDIAPFKTLRSVILPELAKSRPSKIKIWSCACSSGQEPYSISIALYEHFSEINKVKFDILATDIDSHILAKAEKAEYSQFEVQRGLSIDKLINYFDQEDNKWTLKPAIKSAVRFQQLNLLDNFADADFDKFDIIFCRNVLIYFDNITKKQILEKIARTMKPESYLLVGSADHPNSVTDIFKPNKKASGLFQLA